MKVTISPEGDTLRAVLKELKIRATTPIRDVITKRKLTHRQLKALALALCDNAEQLQRDLIFWENDGSKLDEAQAEIARLKKENESLRVTDARASDTRYHGL